MVDWQAAARAMRIVHVAADPFGTLERMGALCFEHAVSSSPRNERAAELKLVRAHVRAMMASAPRIAAAGHRRLASCATAEDEALPGNVRNVSGSAGSCSAAGAR